MRDKKRLMILLFIVFVGGGALALSQNNVNVQNNNTGGNVNGGNINHNNSTSPKN